MTDQEKSQPLLISKNDDFRNMAAVSINDQSTDTVQQAQTSSRDGKVKAIIFMNLFSIGAIGNSVFFKLALAQGAHVIDYQVFRNVSLLISSGIELACVGKNPVKEFPWGQKHTLFWRCLTGQAGFFLFNLCLSLIPLTFQMIIFQTSSFWTSILAYLVYREQILPIEILAMIICFAGMVTITMSGAKNAAAEEPSSSGVVQHTSHQLVLGYSLIFATAWIYSANCILNRALKNLHHALVLFWHGVFGLVLALSAVFISSWVTPETAGISLFNYDSNVYGLMLIATLFDTLAVTATTIAFQADSSGFVALISYVNIIYGFLADRIIFKEDFQPIELVAAIVILIVTVGTSVYKLTESKKARMRRVDSFTSAEDLNRSMVKAE